MVTGVTLLQIPCRSFSSIKSQNGYREKSEDKLIGAEHFENDNEIVWIKSILMIFVAHS